MSRSSIASGALGQECCIGWSDNYGQASIEQEPAEGPRAPAQRYTAGQQGQEGNCRDADCPRAIAAHTCAFEWRKRGIRLVNNREIGSGSNLGTPPGVPPVTSTALPAQCTGTATVEFSKLFYTCAAPDSAILTVTDAGGGAADPTMSPGGRERVNDARD